MRLSLVALALLAACDTSPEGCTGNGEPRLGPPEVDAAPWDGGTVCWVEEGTVPCWWFYDDMPAGPYDLGVDGP